MNPFPDELLDHLIAKWREGDLSEAEQAQLEAWLERDPGARRRWVEHLLLEQDLSEGGFPQPAATPPGGSHSRMATWLGMLAAAGVSVALAFLLWMRDDQAGRSAPEAIHGVAVLADTSEVRWGKRTAVSAEALRKRQPLGPGLIDVESGLVQIDFFSGASLTLEGPVLLEIIDVETTRLHHGKIRASVPDSASRLRVLTAGCVMEDLGTEFAVEVNEDGRGELHVLDGAVEFSEAAALPGLPPTTLSTGEALSFAPGGERGTVTSPPTRFIGTEGLLQHRQQRALRWHAHLEQLAQEPETILLFDFSAGASSNRVPNLVPTGPQGVVVGCRPVEGRWPGKPALEFENPSHRIRVNVPGTFDALTLAAWIWIDQVDLYAVPLLMAESDQNHYLFWDLRHLGHPTALTAFFADTMRGSGRPQRNRYPAPHPALRSADTSRWIHLAVTVDNETQQVIHYLDGVATASLRLQETRPYAIGIADIGNWPYRDWATGTQFEIRHLIGRLDEYLISRRAFQPEEIALLFTLGSP